MFRRPSHRRATSRTAPRRGAILLVVLTMLALFAVIGLSFVLYAESEANAARLYKDAASADLKPIDASDAVNGFLGQVIYQQGTDGSALNGHELARLMYGQPGNTSAYNGVGVYSETLDMPAVGLPLTAGTVPPLHRSQVVRFGTYMYDRSATPARTVTVLPDQTYASNGYVDQAGPSLSVPPNLYSKYVGRNAPYTYPDRNNIYLGVQDPATGRVVKPSYHAPSLFGSLDFNSNQNWYTPQGYFQLLRPRPIDNLTDAEITYLKTKVTWPVPPKPSAADLTILATTLSGNSTDPAAPTTFKRAFPFPAPNPDGTLSGDVQNVKYGEGQQTADSVWIDAKLPVVTFRGRKLQPLIAAAVLALDGRVNYNTAGNLVASGNAHGSNQGFTPAEVSLLKILAGASATSYQDMVKQRYGTGLMAPVPPGSAASNIADYFHPDPAFRTDKDRATYPPSYSQVDYDGDGAGSAPSIPSGGFKTSYISSPAPYGNGRAPEATQPPAYFNPFQWNPLTTTGRAVATTGTQFPLADARYLNARYSEKAKYTQGATNLGNYDLNGPVALGFSASTPQHVMNRARALLTPLSNRLSRPGLAPMAIGNIANLSTNAGAPALALNPGAAAPIFADTAALTTALVGPKFDLSANQPFTRDNTVAGNTAAMGGDITGSLTAAAANLRAFLQGVDLNRPLADYRDPASRPMMVPATTPPTVDPNRDWPFLPGTVPSSVTPMVTVTPASSAAANADRQALATDIFNRLCVALNARVFYSPAFGVVLPRSTGAAGSYLLTEPTPVPAVAGFVAKTWTVSRPEYDALRWVAQLSANIVDAIDADDISTVFQWNSPPTPPAGGPPSTTTAFTPDTPGGLSDCVVFGVEKPKLLINEAYAEVANKEADYAKNQITGGDKFTVRFFLELLNPNNEEFSNTPSVPPATPVIAKVDQSARNGGRASLQFPASGGVVAYSCYRIRVYDKGITAANEAATTSNFNYVLGQPATATAAKLEASFLNVKTVVTDVTEQGQLPFFVEPNNGAFRSEPAASAGPPAVVRGRNGFCVVGPELDPTKTESPATAYAPKTNVATDPANFLLMKPTPAAPGLDQLEYDCGIAPPADPDDIKVQVVDKLNEQESHTVLLQRLANPYQPENASAYNPANGPYNPYITVDILGGVRINDAIRIGQRKPPKPNGNRATPAKPDQNFALGRAQPYAGYQTLGVVGTPTFQTAASVGTPPLGTTLAVLQNPQPAPAATEPRNTFFRHNSLAAPATLAPTVTFPPPPAGTTETLIHEFKEPFHPDRRLINPLEVLHLSAYPSHLLTYNFARPNGTSPYNPTTPPGFHQEELSRVALPTAAAGSQPSLLYRALEVLNVKPWTYGVPHAGRTPGGVNINLINDEVAAPVTPPMLAGDSAVFSAVMDKQAANVFTDADVNTLWKAVRASRSPAWTTATPAVGATVDEWDPNATPAPGFGKDRPFKGFGVGQYDTSVGGVASTQGLESTLLRSGSTPGTPLFLNTAQTDPYRQLELLRKATNNLTTVSDNFLVVFTVGFFEIDEPSFAQVPSRVVLRREAYESVPGDLRSQFTAVLDRTGLAMNPNAAGDTGRFVQAAAATNLEPLPGRSASGKQFKRFRLRFPASGQHPTTKDIQVRDMPTVSGTNSTVFTVAAGTRLRLGDGPNADVLTVTTTDALGGQYNFNKSPAAVLPQVDYPSFEPTTGLATVVVEVEVDATGNAVAGSRLPNLHFAGELISLVDNEAFDTSTPPASTTIFVPGNPGKVTNFSPNDARFRGVVRYFGQLKP